MQNLLLKVMSAVRWLLQPQILLLKCLLVRSAQAMHAIDDPVRPNWSNLPSGILDFDRNGVRIGDLDDRRVAAMFAFLASALSSDGYGTVVDVVGADEVL